MPRRSPSARTRKAILAFFVAVILLSVLRRAWVCDDAFITLRTVDHFVHGRGLVWNVGFRVQTYTHPLWLFVVTPFYALIRQPFVSLVLPALLVTATTLVLLFTRVARSLAHATLAFVALALSRSFLDFGTSGLENPLVHLGLVLAVLGLDSEPRLRSRRVGAALAMLALTRNDAALLIAPAFAWTVLPELRDRALRKRGFVAIAIAVIPVLLWMGFSLVYYGVPFPNTAYAKLFAHHGPMVELGRAGRYALAHLMSEPLTLALPFVGIGLAIVDGDPRTRALGAGLVLMLVYLVNVGGDFMLGRFLTPPLFLAVLALARSAAVPASTVRVLPVMLGLAVLAIPEWTAPTRRVHDGGDEFGIADERDHWGPDTRIGALRDRAGAPRGPYVSGPRAKAEHAPDHVVAEIVNTAGFAGFYAGPRYHMIDAYGLTEGFVARIPAIREATPRAGHNYRYFQAELPRSYQSVIDGRPFACALPEPAACALLEDTILVEHAPLFDARRWAAIVRLNTGYHRARVPVWPHRRPFLEHATAESLAVVPRDGAAWNRPPARTFNDSGILVRFPPGTRADGLVWSADRNDCLAFHVLAHGRRLGTLEVRPVGQGDGLFRRARALPPEVRGREFDAILVEPTCGDGSYGLAALVPITRSSTR